MKYSDMDTDWRRILSRPPRDACERELRRMMEKRELDLAAGIASAIQPKGESHDPPRLHVA